MSATVIHTNRSSYNRQLRSRHDVVIVGGGQAGLALGYYLARRGVDFVILDAERRTGDVWRKRWDSLRLFTPARFSALPGQPFPADTEHLPHKDEVAEYLETYARRFDLPIRHGERVVRLDRRPDRGGFLIETENTEYEAEQVVVATGPFQSPVIPAMSSTLSNSIVQMHSSEYRSPSGLPPGDVLVVGGGNSGVQIAAELAGTRRTWLSVGEPLPTLPDSVLGRSIFWWLEYSGAMNITVDSRMGRRGSEREFLIGKSIKAASRADGVHLLSRTERADRDTVLTSDGRVVQPATIIWATGYRQEFSWINLPVFDERGRPAHRRGVTSVGGLYFLGLPWQHTRGSALIGWVGRDAEYLDRVLEA